MVQLRHGGSGRLIEVAPLLVVTELELVNKCWSEERDEGIVG